MELDDNEKVSAIPGAENKGEIAYNQDIKKLTDLKQAALKENISVQELQKIKEKTLQVIQEAKDANAQQQNANDIVGTFERLPQNVKDYYESKGIDAITTALTPSIFENETTFPDGFTIPNSITSIGRLAFGGATLPKGFTVPDSITSIGAKAFQTATLPVGFTLPSSVKLIEDFVFARANLPKVFTIPSSVTSIGYGAFRETTLPDGFTLPNSITLIGDYAFQETTLPDGFTLPNSITSIGVNTFGKTTLPDGFTIPSSVTSIQNSSFLVATLPNGTPIQKPPLPNGNDLTLNSDGTWA